MGKLEGNVAIITGGARGQGAAEGKLFAAEGAKVVLADMLDEVGERTAGEIGADYLHLDVTSEEDWASVVKDVVDRHGRIDTLVNNAGFFIAKPFTQYSEADYAAVLGVNLTGFFHMTQLAIAEMEKRGSGHIVQITTSLIDHANSHVPSVLASLTKGGLDAATRSLAIEYAKRGIRVNAVAPGVIKTPMHPVETHHSLGGLHPLGRMGEIADIVDAILYLESATFVTGETLHVDGGQSAGH